jgi:chemotaxis protein MotB
MNTRISRPHVSQERWLVSYADFITLLFAFFVVLYAFAKADQKQHRQVSAAIDSGFRSLSIIASDSKPITESTQDRSIKMPRPQHDIELSSSPVVLRDLENMRRDLLNRLSPQIAQRTVAVQLSPDGLVISLREAGFFDSAKAVPRPASIRIVREIAESIRGTPYEVRVEGHTDNISIRNSNFDSNWELSAARATSMARLLLRLNVVPPGQLSAAGYAEYHPVATNSTAEGRAENRRVDLVIMPRTVLPVPSSQQPASAP